MPPPLQEKRIEPLAVASFFLGIASVFCPIGITGLLAVILGHVACRRAGKLPVLGGSRGLAIAGFSMGYLSLLVTGVILAYFLSKGPALFQSKEKGKSLLCVSYLKQIGLALRIYASDNNDQFPPTLVAISNELSNPQALVCPMDKSKIPPQSWDTVTASSSSYQYFGAGKKADANTGREVILICPIHKHKLLQNGEVESGP
jgi:hypothetical protein